MERGDLTGRSGEDFLAISAGVEEEVSYRVVRGRIRFDNVLTLEYEEHQRHTDLVDKFLSEVKAEREAFGCRFVSHS